ncbi:Asp23/Gls24 family envelope stress response protein [Alkaliphilus sp. B6464]|uniref:Asp23/Gls24 family envelope stress response protein n=1 Tax=Alkaliphilus sp. B6464 TaxID=2731219 RepID=UPI001BA6DBEF|nr:Asp23/Gls24 family envelope stress response protein [Alkaliphilus sp. B6464]QUH22048.1 Asp23/Gls24 family envelope stress response protein [Alkaliphilus sp. B6464]
MKNILIKESPEGNIYLSFEAIKSIVNESVLSSVGVYKKDPNFFDKIFKNENVKIDTNKNKLILDIPIKIIYGNNIPNTCTEVQNTISYNLSIFLGIKNIVVNILVDGLVMDDDLEKIARKREQQDKKDKFIF